MSAERALARIDLAAIRRNAARLARAAGRARLCAVVKADAYGHGAVPVARAAMDGGATRLAVATLPEALALRGAGVRGDLMVMSPLTGPEIAEAVAAGLEIVCWTPEAVHAAAAAAGPGEAGRVHLEIDTGMGRLGARPGDLPALARAAEATGIEVVGLMTHFATADEREGEGAGFMAEQLVRFRGALGGLRTRFPGAIAHAANSAATLRDARTHLDMVRCGIALYGCSPFATDPAADDLVPAMTWTSYVAQLKTLRSRESVGYGRTHRVARGTRIAIVPVGYADGYARALSNRAHALVGGGRVPVVGRVSMDLLALDLGPEADAAVGDEVVLIGRQGDERITADEMAAWRGTIAYEVTCDVGRRVRREHVG